MRLRTLVAPAAGWNIRLLVLLAGRQGCGAAFAILRPRRSFTAAPPPPPAAAATPTPPALHVAVLVPRLAGGERLVRRRAPCLLLALVLGGVDRRLGRVIGWRLGKAVAEFGLRLATVIAPAAAAAARAAPPAGLLLGGCFGSGRGCGCGSLLFIGDVFVLDDRIGLADRCARLWHRDLRLAALHAVVGRDQRFIAADHQAQVVTLLELGERGALVVEDVEGDRGRHGDG